MLLCAHCACMGRCDCCSCVAPPACLLLSPASFLPAQNIYVVLRTCVQMFGLTTDEMLVSGLQPGSHVLPHFGGTHVYPLFPGDAAQCVPAIKLALPKCANPCLWAHVAEMSSAQPCCGMREGESLPGPSVLPQSHAIS